MEFFLPIIICTNSIYAGRQCQRAIHDHRRLSFCHQNEATHTHLRSGWCRSCSCPPLPRPRRGQQMSRQGMSLRAGAVAAQIFDESPLAPPPPPAHAPAIIFFISMRVLGCPIFSSICASSKRSAQGCSRCDRVRVGTLLGQQSSRPHQPMSPELSRSYSTNFLA